MIETTLGEVNAAESDQPEKLSNASNRFGHGDNGDEKSDNEKH